MISIPVRLYTGTADKDVSFHQLHAKDHSRIGYQKVCKAEDKEVPPEEIVRGYEVSKGQYVEVTDEELDQVAVKSQHTVELVQFVKSDEVDPAYYQRSYLVEPEETGVKAYSLLLRAMEKAGYQGLARITLRNKEQLCLLRWTEGALILETLHWPDEVRLDEAPKIPKAMASEAEVKMAHGLIEALAAPFEPEKFHDSYREAVLELVEAKQAGREVVREPVVAAGEAPSDLMAALRASMAALGKGREENDEGEEAAEKAPARRKAAPKRAAAHKKAA